MRVCCVCGKELDKPGAFCSSRRCVVEYQRVHIKALNGKSLREAAIEIARQEQRLTLREQAEERMRTAVQEGMA